MNRKEVMSAIIKVAEKLAKDYGFENKELSYLETDPIWGDLLRERIISHGELPVEIKWFSDEDTKKIAFVWIRYRFACPVLSVRLLDGSFASFQFSETSIDSENYEYSESQIFKEGGHALYLRIREKLKEYNLINE